MRRTRTRVPRSRLLIALTVALGLTASLGLPQSAVAADRPVAVGVVAQIAATTAVEAAVDAAIVPMADLSRFDPANIISDALFYDGAAMSSGEIQRFLDDKIGRCTNGRCLNVQNVSVSSRERRVSTATGNLICEAIRGGTMKASELIYRMQVACGISAKVILAMLEKEQSLVTSTAPSNWNLQAAMGQSCPDTAPCDPAFKGLGPQIVGGVTQLKVYKAARFGKQPGRNYIQYHPEVRCGGTFLDIKNYATAALYSYTPYQPNRASINARYGEGDGCSSYGNRNFFHFYTDWFGSTQGVAKPVLRDLRDGSHVLGLDARGDLWAYPYSTDSVWGDRVKVGSGLSAKHIVPVGDLGRTGRQQIIAVTSGGKAWRYTATSATSFGTGVQLDVDWSGMTGVLAAGDFDGDGLPDVFTIARNGDLLLWRGTQFGTLRPGVVVGRGWNTMTLLGSGTDHNGDGIPDVLARDGSGNLWMYPGDGSSGWKPRQRIGTGWGEMTAILSVRDFTGDGRADILARQRNGDLKLYEGTGKGAVSYVRRVGTGWNIFPVLTTGGPVVRGASVAPAGLGDTRGTGGPDVMAVTPSGAASVYSGDGSGGWRSSGRLGLLEIPGARYITVGDFGGDGRSDLLRIRPNGVLELLRGRAGGTYVPAQQIGRGWQGFTNVVGGIDFDGDGNTDVLAQDAQGNLRLYPGNGRGGWASGAGRIVGTGWGVIDLVVHAGDFDGDGNGDLIARRKDTGALMLYPTDGDGGWRTPVQIGKGWAGFTALTVPGDFDGRGGPDVLARTAKGDLLLYAGDGTGGWRGSTSVGRGWGAFSQLR